MQAGFCETVRSKHYMMPVRDMNGNHKVIDLH